MLLLNSSQPKLLTLVVDAAVAATLLGRSAEVAITEGVACKPHQETNALSCIMTTTTEA